MKELGRLVSYTQNVTCALPGGSQAYNTGLDVAVQSFSRVRLCDLMEQLTRVPCPSLSPEACSNSCLLSR